MLSINHLTIQYGGKHLFKDVSACIHGRERIGLVGVNGSGKSTLLKIMSGMLETDDGVITRSRHATVGYLPQEVISVVQGRTLYEEAETAFADTLALQKELEEIHVELACLRPEDPRHSELLRLQGEIQLRLEHADVFCIRARIEKVLTGLGFRESDFDRNCLSFSGGWLMRLMLARLLLAEPSLLLLDEPTNHLDLETVTWLEGFIKAYRGAIVVVSHDRAFLDAVTSLTWELGQGNLTVYAGSYTKYVAAKKARTEALQAAHANQQARIRETMRFVERFRAKATKARQVQSRVKQLEKMELVECAPPEHGISFSFPPSAPGGRMAVTVDRLAKGYAGKAVFTDVSFSLERGNKMAVVGPNGAGKSTLLRLIAGMDQPDGGSIIPGHALMPAYFGQHQAQDLDPDASVLETVEASAASGMTTTRIRSLLGAFLFRGDDVEKKVSVLSGGEKSRLALARMIASPANLLLMDEPTNHLDILSQEVLEAALRRYDGSIIVVSHNRYFLDRFVNRVLELNNGCASLYEGTMGEYLEKKASSGAGERKTADEGGPASRDNNEEQNPRARTKEERQAQARLRQEKNRRLSSLRKEIERTEGEIGALETQKAELERRLADPGIYGDKNTVSEINGAYHTAIKRLEDLYPLWEGLHAEIERLEATLGGP